jgi:hypothetical protein
MTCRTPMRETLILFAFLMTGVGGLSGQVNLPYQTAVEAVIERGSTSFLADSLYQGITPLARARDPQLIPLIGAAIGAVGVSYWTYRACQKTDCILHPLLPPATGAVLGALAGFIVEGLIRVGERLVAGEQPEPSSPILSQDGINERSYRPDQPS